MKYKELPSLERLQELLSYNPYTGYWDWISKNKFSHVTVGSIAGNLHKTTGYWVIKIDGRTYASHRLAWLYMTGKAPESIIDHKDGDKGNNQWNNLREANYSQNSANSKSYRKLPKGVYRTASATNPYAAAITINYSRSHIGVFQTVEEAHKAYCLVAKSHHQEFARTA